MTLEQLRQKQADGTLTDETWEAAVQELLPVMLNQKKQERWAELLEQSGIRRQSDLRLSWHRRYWAAAAAAILVVGAMVWCWNVWSQSSNIHNLAHKHLETPFLLNGSATRDAATAQLDVYRGQALEAFNNKFYEKSIAYLQKIETEQALNASDYFQMGLALMYQPTPNYTQAIRAFERAKALDSSKYKDEIQWYSALCYVLLQDTAKARSLLQEIANSPSSRNQTAAIELLRAL